MSTVIEDFFVALGFQIDADELSAFDEQVAQANETLLTIGATAIAAAGGIFAFVSEVTGGIDDLADFAAVNIDSIEALQELGFAAQSNGSSLDAVKSSIESLNGVIGEASLGVGKGAAIFEKLGLSARDSNGQVKTASMLLEEVADKFVGLSREERIALAQKLGIDASLIPLLSQGREAIASLRSEARELGVVTQEEADISGQLGDAMDRLEFLMLSLSRSIAVALTPTIAGVVTSIKEFVVQNREAINSGITTFVKALTTVLSILWTLVYRVGQAFFMLARALLDNKIVIYALTAAAAGFVALNLGRSIMGLAAAFRTATTATWSFSLPLIAIPLLIGAIAIAIGLLIDDFITFREGGDSIIGGLVEKFPMVGEVIESVGNVVQSVFTWWRNLADQVMGSIIPLVSSLINLSTVIFNLLWPIVKTVFQGWAEILGLVLPPLASIATFIIDVVASAITFAVDKMTAFVDKIKGAADFLADFFGQGSDVNVSANSTTSSTSSPLSTPRNGASVVGGNQSTVANSTTTSNVITAPITVVTSDPAKAGESVRKELDAMNKQTTRNGQTATKL